jgi:hypothetical protein
VHGSICSGNRIALIANIRSSNVLNHLNVTDVGAFLARRSSANPTPGTMAAAWKAVSATASR